MEKNLKRICLANAVLAVLEFYAVGFSLWQHGFQMLQYYTELSNLFSGFASLYMVMQIRKENRVTAEAKGFRYIALCLTTVTFLVVITVLGPMYGYGWILFAGQMLWTHTLCPILSALIFLFLERRPKLEKKQIAYTLVPTLIYGIVAVIGNLTHVIVGPYPFLMVLDQPWWASVLWFIAILAGAYALAWGYYRWDQTH
ncbi:MAG: hypothetical protein J6D18_00315 [Erysipelotrichaceae bacterium]|nr:hypothetical protein [Erysipelotrichaceae bacterium]